MENTLVSYKGDAKLKARFVKEIGKHRKADQLLQGTYGKQNGTWKGCAVSCSLRSLDIIDGNELRIEYSTHKDYESRLGLPEWLARLEDTIFEGLPKADAMKWPEQFSKAIPVGVNLEPVKWKFATFILKENIERVLTLDIKADLKEQVVRAIQGVLKLNEDAINTGTWNESAARSAWSAAESAAWSAWSAAESAESAAESAAEAARSAAWSAAWSAWSAAESAAWSAWSAAESAWSAAFQNYSRELLRLLRAAK